MQEYQRVLLSFTHTLHRRLKTIAKQQHLTMSNLIRLAVTDKLDEIDAKERERAFYAEAEKNKRRKPTTTINKIVPLDQRQENNNTPADEPIDRFSAIFEDHAQRLAEVYDKPADLAIRQREAFAAIKKAAPLTYADDRKITARLESLIADRLETAAPTVREAPQAAPPTADAFASMLAPFLGALQKEQDNDPLAGKLINASRIHTRAVVVDSSKGKPKEKR